MSTLVEVLDEIQLSTFTWPFNLLCLAICLHDVGMVAPLNSLSYNDILKNTLQPDLWALEKECEFVVIKGPV